MGVKGGVVEDAKVAVSLGSGEGVAEGCGVSVGIAVLVGRAVRVSTTLVAAISCAVSAACSRLNPADAHEESRMATHANKKRPAGLLLSIVVRGRSN